MKNVQWRTYGKLTNRLLLLVTVTAIIGGCDVFGCDPKTRTYELVPGEIGYDFLKGLKEETERQGFHCDGQPIRNGAGTQIGTRYTCTKC